MAIVYIVPNYRQTLSIAVDPDQTCQLLIFTNNKTEKIYKLFYKPFVTDFILWQQWIVFMNLLPSLIACIRKKDTC
jgi:lipid II:glycine glycyltransferase (peptidoglycan interpeptide bridge formation enzyme)